MSFKDLFSAQSKAYAKYRPTYPKELFAYLSAVAPDHSMVWDCGTGNGQAALGLAEYFAHIVATDLSQLQLQQASKHQKIEYRICSAETTDLVNHSISLISVAQAFHWFRQPEFFLEVKRVAKPGAILAIWCYELSTIAPELDALVTKLYSGTLGEYWDSARKLVEEGYRHEKIPFPEIASPSFELTAEWSAEDFLGYLSTWSALQKYKTKNGVDPLLEFAPDFLKAYGGGKQTVTWPLSLRVFRINN
jgi:SAM-dependent methyltransferase